MAYLLHGLGLSLSLLSCAVSAELTKHNSDAFARRCNSFDPEEILANVTRHDVEYLVAGTVLSFPDAKPSCKRPSQAVPVALCRIALSIATSQNSSVRMETWMPEDWTGRVLTVGNGGLDGCIHYEDLAYGTKYAFAAIACNNGHDGNSGVPFQNNPEAVVDYSWRAIHRSVLAGKKIVKHFYEKNHSASYFMGCSLGGRQGISTAERFPEDFDGIVVGAPAVDFNNLVSWRASFLPITGPVGSPRHIPAELWKTAIHDEILNQCDCIDGVRDGIIEDPSLCNFRPETLQCKSRSQEGCLTSVQVDTVRTIFSPFTRDNGELIYPAMNPGNELRAADKFYAGKPFSYSEDWFKYVIYDATWDPLTFNDQDAAVAEAINPGDIKTWPCNLTDFESRQGKIIAYHGQQDDQITSFNTARFYRFLLRGTGKTPDQMDELLRYFRISGMFHCSGGPGEWAFGQSGTASAEVSFRSENNVLAAMVDWVERGIAPETIEGTKFVNDTEGSGVAFRRRHCRFPFRNTYLGGDPKARDRWDCRMTDPWKVA